MRIPAITPNEKLCMLRESLQLKKSSRSVQVSQQAVGKMLHEMQELVISLVAIEAPYLTMPVCQSLISFLSNILLFFFYENMYIE